MRSLTFLITVLTALPAFSMVTALPKEDGTVVIKSFERMSVGPLGRQWGLRRKLKNIVEERGLAACKELGFEDLDIEDNDSECEDYACSAILTGTCVD